MENFIPVNSLDLSGNEKKYLTQCIETGWISSEGPFIKSFEEKFSARVGRKYGIAVSNGSVALDVAVRSLRMKPGSEVIMPAFTIISCATAIVRADLTPVLVDADPLTWNINPDLIESKITDKTKAIMVVHIYGLPCDMDPIKKIANKYGLFIIEDAAEVIGQAYRDRPCGSFGEVSTFSFYPNKHVTTGEGGMIVTDDSDLAEYCRSLRNLCFQPKRRFIHEELGFNYRMSNIQAALGVAQLERLDESVKRKREMGNLYKSLLSAIPGVEIPLEKTDYAENIYWVYGLVLADSIPFDADEISSRLTKLKIGTRPFFWGMHEQPVFMNMGLFKGEYYPITERISRRGFYIPSGLGLTEEQQFQVVKALKKALSD